MRKLFLLLVLSGIFLFAASQVPSGMQYRAIARNSDATPMSNQLVTLKLDLKGDPSGNATVYYSEEHIIRTDNYGGFDLVIGNGKILSGTFPDVPWSRENIWLIVSMKDNSGNMSSSSQSRLMTVPYAFHAATASKISGMSTEANTPGVPAAVWSLKGNSNSNPPIDKLGTTDFKDLIMVTNNLERLKIAADGDVSIANNLVIDKDLTVKRNVFLNTVSGSTTNNGPFTVANASPSHLTGNLTVDLNALVSGRAGVGALDNAVKFNVVSPGTNNPFRFNVSGTVNEFKMNADGQLYLRSTKEGLSGSTGNYAMMIEGEKQGMVIKLNENIIPEERNHFISFRGSTGNEVGRIEGQTSDQLHNSFEYDWTATMAFLDMAFVIAEGVATTSQSDMAETAVMMLEGVQAAAKWIEYLINADANVGISYASGNGDYAEWLEKTDVSEKFSFGDIVSVTGGKISKNTSGANQLMVISRSPIVLGNTPPKAIEKNYEKVAFMGQVPVKVIGQVNIGDYIIASGKNDGMGVAVHPSKMTIADYKKIVGVAWSASLLKNGVSLVTLAIGINNNDLVGQIEKQQKEITQLKTQFNEVLTYLQAKDPAFKYGISVSEPQQVKNKLTEFPVNNVSVRRMDYADKLIGNPGLLDKALVLVRESFQNKGVDINKHPELRRLFNDREYLHSELRRMMK